MINESEAEVVRKVFFLYLELGGVDLLKQETDHLGLVTKRHEDGSGFRGGLPFSRGNLYQMLHNPIYAGEIAHKGKVYPGQHERIIAPDLWEAVQKRLSANTRERQSPTNITGTFILTGKLFDETGDRLSPTSANRNGKRHRYYVSRRLLRTGDRSNGGWRLPARQLEKVVIDGVVALLNDPLRLSRELPSLSADDTRRLFKGATELASGTASEGHNQTGAMLPALLQRVTVSGDTIRIELSNRALLDGTTGPGMIDTIEPGEPATIEVPFQLRRRGVEIRLVLRAEGAEAPDDRLIALIARSHRWLDQLTSGAVASIPRDCPGRGHRRGRRQPVPAARLPCARNRRGTHEREAGGRTDGGEAATDFTDTIFMGRAASSVELVTLPPLFPHSEVESVLVIVVGRTERPLRAAPIPSRSLRRPAAKRSAQTSSQTLSRWFGGANRPTETNGQNRC